VHWSDNFGPEGLSSAKQSRKDEWETRSLFLRPPPSDPPINLRKNGAHRGARTLLSLKKGCHNHGKLWYDPLGISAGDIPGGIQPLPTSEK